MVMAGFRTGGVVYLPMRYVLIAAVLALPCGAAAQAHSPRECLEGGDFIRNAALSRDNGVTREFFVNRLEEDFVAIRGFAPELRWFVHSPADEAFLRTEVEAVFDSPQDSEQHRSGFIVRCAQRAGWPTASAG
jgi:hypothetical protein